MYIYIYIYKYIYLFISTYITKSADGHMKKTQARAIEAMCPVDVI